MAREKKHFRCKSCGASASKWAGQCEKCGEWNTIEEEQPSPRTSRKEGAASLDFTRKERTVSERLSSGIAELDRVLGGGFFPDSLTLLVGDPGIGKSTLALQVARNLSRAEKKVLVVSGEESAFQIADRAERLGGLSEALQIANGFSIESVVAAVEKERPNFLVVDSVQTFSSADIPSAAGSIPQIRAVTETLMGVAKAQGVPVVLIGQVTKGGEMAGPQLLAHLVDTVLIFEGDPSRELRVLRASKNRFGGTGEAGVFEMTSGGLTEVKNPSAAFLEGRLSGALGSAIFPALEGGRPFLVEVQALTAPSPFGYPKRSASGVSLSRLSLLLAVLERHAGVKISALDVFANVVGGIRIEETASDLAVALSVASSKLKKAIPEDMMIVGELGLSGEIRAVPFLERRLQEGEKMGFASALLPAAQKKPTTKLKTIPVKTMGEAMRVLGEAFSPSNG